MKKRTNLTNFDDHFVKWVLQIMKRTQRRQGEDVVVVNHCCGLNMIGCAII